MSDDSSSRIVAELREWIVTAAPGSRLPSTRALVAQYQASPVTVQKALRTLIAQGLVETRTGVGTFVLGARAVRPNDYGWQTAALGTPLGHQPRSSTALRVATNDVIALHSGYPDRELLPERLVRSAFVRAARSDAVIGRPPAAGLPELQGWFAPELGTATPAGVVPPTSSDVIVLPGSQSGLTAAFRALAGPGRPLLVESPTYWGAILAAAQAGVRLVPIPCGLNGPDPDELYRALEETGARAFYAQPNFANPTGTSWSPAIAGQVLDLVRARGAFLIEDDWAHDLGIETASTPIAARDDSGHAVYIRSLTKSVSPAVRVAAIIARGPARERILAEVQAHAMYVSGVLQNVAHDVVTQPAWRTHLRSLRRQLTSRRDLLVEAVREHIPDAHLHAVPQGGLNLWVRLPDDTNLYGLMRACEAAGTLISIGDEWFPAEPTGPYLRLNYSGPQPGAFPDGARVIGQSLVRLRTRDRGNRVEVHVP